MKKIFKIIKQNNLKQLKIRLNNHPDDVNAVQERTNITPLIEASARGNIHMVRSLIDRGANINDTECFGDNALMYACSFNRLDVAKLLIQKGADINYKNNRGCTAYYYAERKGYLDIMKLLIDKGADINHKITPTSFLQEIDFFNIIFNK